MSARYWIVAAVEILPELLDTPPDGVRVLRYVAAPELAPHPGSPICGLRTCCYVEVEDVGAPDECEGRVVDVTFQSHYDDQYVTTHVTIMSRDVMTDRDAPTVTISHGEQNVTNVDHAKTT